jgi:signal transduction histidine kinase
LFQKFYRVKTEHTEHVAGTGLGLWITKAICEQMGGEISVESMEGVGSKFTVIFPLVETKKQAA